jgi:hypothetical protein
VDNVEIMDMISYNGEACVMSNEGDMACAIAPEEGTIVESALSSSVEEALPEGAVKVFPNPANDLLNVAIDVTGAEEALITLVAMDGRVMQEQQVEMGGFYQLVPVNVAQLPAGMYFIKVQAGSKMTTQKVVIR